MANRARLLVPFTKDALTFGGVHRLIRFETGRLRAEATWRRAVDRALSNSSDEVKACTKRAAFVGKWFAQTGSNATVLAVIGVRP
jgi:hypothetical protein